MATYIMMTNTEITQHRVVSGTRTLRSVMSMRARLALPVRVAVVLLSR